MIASGDFIPGTEELDVVGLIAAAKAGRPEALEALVARYTPVLWNVARQQGLDRTTSEDVVQTAWLRLLRDPASISTPRAVLGWLITVTKREAWRVSAARRREQTLDGPGDVADVIQLQDVTPTPEQEVVTRDEHAVLWEAVRQLHPRCQELLRVVAFVPRPEYSTVAQALGMPIGSIGPTRGRCLAKLRALLAESPQWSET